MRLLATVKKFSAAERMARHAQPLPVTQKTMSLRPSTM